MELMICDGKRVAIAAEADGLRDAALERAALIGRVTNADQNTEAVEALKAIKTVTRAVESARKKVKEPVLDLAREIDRLAKQYVKDLEAEEQRIATACSDYQTEQLEIQRAAARAAAEEAARIERERQEAERKAREEVLRQQREAEAKARAEAAAAKNEADRIAAEQRAKLEQERIATEAEKARMAAEERAKQALEAVAVKAPERVAGETVRPTWQWEVTDIWTLARLNPGLVKIEPRRQEINEVVNRMAEAGTPKLAGLRIWEEVKVGVRTAKVGKVIDV